VWSRRAAPSLVSTANGKKCSTKKMASHRESRPSPIADTGVGAQGKKKVTLSGLPQKLKEACTSRKEKVLQAMKKRQTKQKAQKKKTKKKNQKKKKRKFARGWESFHSAGDSHRKVRQNSGMQKKNTLWKGYLLQIREGEKERNCKVGCRLGWGGSKKAGGGPMAGGEWAGRKKKTGYRITKKEPFPFTGKVMALSSSHRTGKNPKKGFNLKAVPSNIRGVGGVPSQFGISRKSRV